LCHEWRWALLGTEFNFMLITDCQCLESAKKKKSINSGFISRIALIEKSLRMNLLMSRVTTGGVAKEVLMDPSEPGTAVESANRR